MCDTIYYHNFIAMSPEWIGDCMFDAEVVSHCVTVIKQSAAGSDCAKQLPYLHPIYLFS